MTTATRKRRPRTAKALVPRTPAIDALAADLLILSARLAETPPPVFWAKGELDARTASAVPESQGYDDNYRRVLADPEWDWDWYRASLLADELEAVPVYSCTVVAPLGELSEENQRRFAAVFSNPDDKGAQWRPVDVPGAGASPPSPTPSEGTVPGPAIMPSPPEAAGPGTQDEAHSPGCTGDCAGC